MSAKLLILCIYDIIYGSFKCLIGNFQISFDFPILAFNTIKQQLVLVANMTKCVTQLFGY